jgi:hypothetical protein
MHYPEDRPPDRAGATFRAVQGSSGPIEKKDLKSAEMTTAK